MLDPNDTCGDIIIKLIKIFTVLPRADPPVTQQHNSINGNNKIGMRGRGVPPQPPQKWMADGKWKVQSKFKDKESSIGGMRNNAIVQSPPIDDADKIEVSEENYEKYALYLSSNNTSTTSQVISLVCLSLDILRCFAHRY